MRGDVDGSHVPWDRGVFPAQGRTKLISKLEFYPHFHTENTTHTSLRCGVNFNNAARHITERSAIRLWYTIILICEIRPSNLNLLLGSGQKIIQ